MNPTEEQRAIYAYADQLMVSLKIEAYAGTGKSTTLEGFAPRIPPGRRVLAIAFNKKTADELVKRMPSNFAVKTMNGLGHGALSRAIGRKLTLEKNKLGGIISDMLRAEGVPFGHELWEEVRQMVTRARNQGLVPEGTGFTIKPLLEDTKDNWEELADDAWLKLSDDNWRLSRAVLLESIRQGMRDGIVDFDDQIYLSTLIAGSYEKYDDVLVDEAQDLSPLNHLQVKKSLNFKSRLIIVGDPRQAIYAFRGADSDSMGRMVKLREQWVNLRLSRTFRCPKVVVARNQEHAPGYNAAEGNIEGLFKHFKGPWNWQDIREISLGDKVAILCRNNAPLINMAFALIRDRIGVQVLGRDIGKSMMSMVKKICGDDLELSASECNTRIEQWMEVEIANARAKDKDEKIAAITDRGESLLAVIESGGAKNLEQIIELIEEIFADKNSNVVLSTGHKAKGLEWPVVLHLDPWRIPSKYAKIAADMGNPVQLEQDMNIKYVIETRAQRALVEASYEQYNKEKKVDQGGTTPPPLVGP